MFVGCVCAERLTQDFKTPRLRERELEGRAERRQHWPTLNWVLSANDNLKLKKEGRIFVLKRGPLGGWAVSYLPSKGDKWVQIPGWYHNPADEKLAAFDAICGHIHSAS